MSDAADREPGVGGGGGATASPEWGGTVACSSKPLVSVVIPTYDRNDHLRYALESVARQTYQPIELVIVDDCSPTPAREVLSEVSLESLAHVRYIRHEENRGANTARNTGIKEATGEFIAFLDDDDTWANEKIEKQVETFHKADSSVGVVYTGARYVDGQNGDDLVITPDNRGNVTREILIGRKFGEFSVMMVRSSVIDEAGLPDERFPSWQDKEWYLRLSLHCKFEPVTEPLAIRLTRHGNQISDNYETKRDISYPLFIQKHRSVAAEYGPLIEQRFMATLSAKLGQAALDNGYYWDARKYLAKSVLYYPVSLTVVSYLLASLGGKYTHKFAKELVRAVKALSTLTGLVTAPKYPR